jgi:hypothetical protein
LSTICGGLLVRINDAVRVLLPTPLWSSSNEEEDMSYVCHLSSRELDRVDQPIDWRDEDLIEAVLLITGKTEEGKQEKEHAKKAKKKNQGNGH